MVLQPCERARMRALLMNVIRSVAHQYGGTIKTDRIANGIRILLPRGKRIICAEKLSEQVSLVRENMVRSFLLILHGVIIVPWKSN